MIIVNRLITDQDLTPNSMAEREKWFRVLMGQEEVAKLIPESDYGSRSLPPEEFQKMLVFDSGFYRPEQV